jgi:hypothetical protein
MSVLNQIWAYTEDPKGENMKKRVLNQKGQGIMEYVILSSLIGIFCLITVKQFGEVIKKRIENMKQQITQTIELKSTK